MTRPPGTSELKTLPFLHTLLVLALAVAWLAYCLQGDPLARSGGQAVTPGSGGVQIDRALDLLSASMTDVLLGFGTIFLFAFGTGIYVRRAQVWIDARSSGEAVAYSSADLQDRALAANEKRGA